MTRPSLMGRLAGRPFVAVLLFVAYGLTIYGWYEGRVVWWLALGAFGAAIRTLSAVSYLRNYKAWRRQWEAMGSPAQGQSFEKKKSGRFLLTVSVLILLAAVLSTAPAVQAYIPESIRHNDQFLTVLPWVVLAATVYLAFRLLRGLWRRIRRGAAQKSQRRKMEKADATAPVMWELSRAAGSPSRRDAEKSLPEYAARLLAENGKDLPAGKQAVFPSVRK